MAAPTEYYVDPGSGNDSTGDGLSDGTAWATIQHALDTITQGAVGDRINVKSGTADTLAAALDIATNYGSPSQTAPLIIQGYATSAGDGDFEAGTGIGEVDGDGSYGMFAAATNYVYVRHMKVHNCGSARQQAIMFTTAERMAS